MFYGREKGRLFSYRTVRLALGERICMNYDRCFALFWHFSVRHMVHAGEVYSFVLTALQTISSLLVFEIE